MLNIPKLWAPGLSRAQNIARCIELPLSVGAPGLIGAAAVATAVENGAFSPLPIELGLGGLVCYGLFAVADVVRNALPNKAPGSQNSNPQ